MKHLTNATVHRRFHAVMIGVWLALLIPSLSVWKESIYWLVIMSWYAIFIGHITAFEASKTREDVDNAADVG